MQQHPASQSSNSFIHNHRPSYVKSEILSNSSQHLYDNRIGNDNYAESRSSIIASSSGYLTSSTDKSLPLTVACHFKVHIKLF